MRIWPRVRRWLALAITVVFVLGVLVTPALAAGGKGFSAPKSSGGFTSGSRSFSTPKTSSGSSSRSLSTPKPSTKSTPQRSFSTPSPSYSGDSKSYSTPNSPSYSSGSRSYSSPSRSFSSLPLFGKGSNTPPPATYDTGKTKYPSRPPVVVYGPTPQDPTYWHDYYYGMPWYWRVWHRPVYTVGTGWGISWVSVVAAGIGIWILLGIISASTSRRRRH